MMTPLLAGMPGWRFAVGLLALPMAVLLGVVGTALVLHWMIERWAPGPKDMP
jgi:hypothetical protein